MNISLNRLRHRNVTWVLRYWLGVMMVYHSYWAFFDEGGMSGFADYLNGNGIPFPFFMAVMAKSSEFFGGILLLIGLLTRVASLLIFCVMFVAVFHMHHGLVWSEGELAFNYLLMAAILFFEPNTPFNLIGHLRRGGMAR